MNITVDLNINANEELANALLTLAAIMHNTIPSYAGISKNSNEIKEIGEQNNERTEAVINKKVKEKINSLSFEENRNEKIKAVRFEDVRTKLAELSQVGKQVEVKALIEKFGARKLTEVPEEKYEELLREAETICI